MRKYLIDIKADIKNDAGSKARNDISKILLKDGYSVLYYNNGNNFFVKIISYIVCLLKIKFNASCVIVQYPLNIKYFSSKIIKIFFPKNSIVIIHDIDSLRLQQNDNRIINEINYLNNYKYKIVHNQHMNEYCKLKGLKDTVVNLDIFDYLLDKQLVMKNEYDKGIAFAGNLSPKKCSFIYKIKKIPMHLYGVDFDKERVSNDISYIGCFSSEILPFILKEQYGLIWDGHSTKECDPYLMYNNPHKLSLYLVSNLPVIVWEKSAIASFVEKYNVGFTINNLDEIEEKIKKISLKEYEEMRLNTIGISKKLISGYFTKKAIDKCLEDIK